MTSESVLAYWILWKQQHGLRAQPPEGCGGGRTYHGLVVEGEALQLPQSVGGGRQLFENHKRLSPHLHGLHGHNVNNLTELGEQSVEGSLQLCGGGGGGAARASSSHANPKYADG